MIYIKYLGFRSRAFGDETRRRVEQRIMSLVGLNLGHGAIGRLDIRAGMALLIATLCAKGVSELRNIGQIDRGYERIEEKLQALGAKIERVSE